MVVYGTLMPIYRKIRVPLLAATLLRILSPATIANRGSTIITTGTPMDATNPVCISLLHTKSKRDNAYAAGAQMTISMVQDTME